jgi:hypothetical protein
MDKKTEEFYDRLKVELDNSIIALYLFKFIVPSDNVARVELAFDCMLLKRQNLKQEVH